MKKKIFLFAGTAMFGLAAWNIYQAYFSTPTSLKDELLITNVEVLTQNESSLPVECYDKYKAYSGGSLTRFWPCADKCEHIWAYSPKKRTICPGSK